MKRTLKKALGFTVLSLLLPCVLLGLHVGCTTHSSTASELRRLQGTWEGFLVGAEADGKNTITITGNSLHLYRDTNFWFETTFTLPASTDPKQLRATIKNSPPPNNNTLDAVVVAIFKIEDGTLTLAMDNFNAEEAPTTFPSATGSAKEADGKLIVRYDLKKVHPQKKNTNYPNPNEPETPFHARPLTNSHRNQ